MARRKTKKVSANVAADLDKEARDEIATTVLDNVRADLRDRREWEERADDAFKMWACIEEKREPAWEGGAQNVVPMLFSAINNWSGLVGTAMFDAPYGKNVHAIPTEPGDVARAQRVEDTMSWQLSVEMGGEYEDSYDRLLPHLALTGLAYKKGTWNDKEDRPSLDFVSSLDVIVPEDTRSMDTARRVTHRMFRHRDEILELGEEGYYVNTDDMREAQLRLNDERSRNAQRESEKEILGIMPVEGQANTGAVFEQEFRGPLPGTDRHSSTGRWIATVDNTTGTLLRLVEFPRKIDTRWADFHFIPSPTGGWHSYGWGHWILVLNRLMDGIFNHYMDAAMIGNSPAVLRGRALGLRGKHVDIYPGADIEVDDPTQLQVLKFPGPDQNLPLLINFITQFSQDISANTDEMQGRAQRGVREPTVRGQIGRVERALSRFKIFAKRVFRGQERELRMLYAMNSLFLPREKQFAILGRRDGLAFQTARRSDFNKRYHIKPTSDPDMVSIERKRAEATEVMQVSMEHPLIGQRPDGSIGNPDMLLRVTRDWLTQMGKKDLALYLPEPPPVSLPPQIENQAMVEGDTPEPKKGEDHVAHIAAHLVALEDEGLPADARVRIEAHITHTRAFQLAEQVTEQDAAGTAPSPAPGPAGPAGPGAPGPGAGPPAGPGLEGEQP